MAKTYGPFGTGAGASMYEAQWSKMMRTVFADGIIGGYLNGLLVYGDSTGMQVKVKSGAAWLRGHYYENDSEEILAVTAAHATLPRWDCVVLEVDWTKSDSQMTVKIIAGTPSANPSLPALTQNTSVWQIPLAKIVVLPTVSTIAASNVSDLRFMTDDGWSLCRGNHTYASATTITVPAGAASLYSVGDKYKYTQNLSQPYTNDPAAGSNITLNMTDTSKAHVGNIVLVSSSAGSENARITAVVANVSITVDTLALNHTTTNPVVYFSKDSVGTKYANIVGVADTLLTITSGTDYAVENTTITSPCYAKGRAVGFPSSFGWSGVNGINVQG